MALHKECRGVARILKGAFPLWDCPRRPLYAHAHCTNSAPPLCIIATASGACKELEMERNMTCSLGI